MYHPLSLTRTSTQSLIQSKMQFTKSFIAVAVIAATGAFAQQCNQGGGFFSCSDAQTACNTVTNQPVSFPNGGTAKQIGGFGSAAVWATRAKSSATTDDMNALCNQIVQSCCSGRDFAQKSTIALKAGEQGSVQIIPV